MALLSVSVYDRQVRLTGDGQTFHAEDIIIDFSWRGHQELTIGDNEKLQNGVKPIVSFVGPWRPRRGHY